MKNDDLKKSALVLVVRWLSLVPLSKNLWESVGHRKAKLHLGSRGSAVTTSLYLESEFYALFGPDLDRAFPRLPKLIRKGFAAKPTARLGLCEEQTCIRLKRFLSGLFFQ